MFPRHICNQVVLTLVDRLMLLRLATAKTVTMLTATMPNGKLELIKKFFPNITTYTIKPEEERKIENVVLIGTSRSLNENVISRILTHEERQHFGKVLVFKPTKKKAKDLFDKIKRIAHIRSTWRGIRTSMSMLQGRPARPLRVM